MHHSFLPQPQQPAPAAVRGLLPLPAGTAYAEGTARSDQVLPIPMALLPPGSSKGPLWPQRIALAFPGGKARRRRTGRFSAFGAALMLGCVGAMGVSPGAHARSAAGIAAERSGRSPVAAVECRLHQKPGAEALSGCMLAQASSRKLNRAVKKGNLKAVKSLVAAGADVNNKDRNGWTPLHLAAKRGYLEIVKALVAAGADLSMSNRLTQNSGQDKKGATPLNLARSYDHQQVVQLLVTEIAKYLVASGGDVNSKDMDNLTPLHYVAKYGTSPEMVDLLVDAGADVNIKQNTGWTPLHYAAKRGYLEIVKALVAAGADLSMGNRLTQDSGNDKKGATPLSLARSYFNFSIGHEQIVKFLATETAKYLVASGGDVNSKDMNNLTPLHYVTAFGASPEMVSLLINAGADVNVRWSYGRTPLHGVPFNDHSNRHEFAQILIDAGADVDAMDSDLKTPLYWAARKGRNKLITTLIDAGADTAAIDEAKRDIERERREREERERREREERERREREERERREREERERREREERERRERQERWSEWQEQQEREALERREREVRELELDLRERRAREELDFRERQERDAQKREIEAFMDSNDVQRRLRETQYKACMDAKSAMEKNPRFNDWKKRNPREYNDFQKRCDKYKP